ncbi:MAG: futalosine hydrolase [Pseudomonadota bacterium]
MSLLIVTSTACEMRAVLNGFNGRGRISCLMPEEGIPKDAPVNERDCLLLVTGAGPINAAFRLGQTLAANPRIHGVLNLGIAGSFDLNKAALTQSVLVEREIAPAYNYMLLADMGPTSCSVTDSTPHMPSNYTDIQAQHHIHASPERGTSPYVEVASDMGPVTELGPRPSLHVHEGNPITWRRLDLEPQRHINRFEVRLPKRCVRGDALTVAGISAYAEYAPRIEEHGALIENLEGFAMALACHKVGIPFMECRTVAYKIGSHEPADWAVNEALDTLGEVAKRFFI